MQVTIKLLAAMALSPGWAAVVQATEATRPLKVFLLAGRSNMEGHAKVETFDYLGDDPATAPLLRWMRGEDGQPRVCDGVWISYLKSRQRGWEDDGSTAA